MKYQAPYGSADPNASYADRNTPGAVAGSKVPGWAIEHPQRELDGLIAKAGLTPSSADLTQVQRAVRSLALNRITVPAGSAGGTANAILCSADPVPASYAELQVFWLTPASTNTAGALTIKVGPLAAVAVTSDGADPAAGALKAGVPAMLVWNGAGYSVLPPGVSVVIATLAEALAGTDNAKLITAARLAAAVQQGQWTYAVADGASAANALVVTLNPVPTSYNNLRVLWVVPTLTNAAGPVSIAINGMAAVPVQVDGLDPPAGVLKAGIPAMLVRTATGYALPGEAGKTRRAMEAFSAAGTLTWTCPHGVTRVFAKVTGGGGGGAGCSSSQSGPSGGAGGTAIGWASVTPGSSYTFIVGAAGTAGASGGGNGGTGGTSSAFGFTATGGGGGGGSANGPGGSASGGQVNLGGGDGTDTISGATTISAVGGASHWGGGGSAGASPATGAAGQAPGSGGGGAYGSTPTAGGAGAPGIITLEY